MRSAITKFDEIANRIEQAIDDGRYPPNTKLPTQRELADQFDTTPVTISKAIKVLVRRHRVEAVTGSGTFVLKKGELTQAIQAEADSDHFNFSILQPCLGYNQPILDEHVKRLNRHKLSSALFEYKEHSGHLQHKEAGMHWCSLWGLKETKAEDFFLVNGAQQALSTVIQLCTKPGDAILVEALTYPGLLAVINLLGRKAVSVELDNEGIVIESLITQQAIHSAALLVTTPSMHNPTTTTMSTSRRLQLSEAIQSLELLTIEDDIYAFLTESDLPRLADLAPNLVFYVSSLSKAVSPGLRAGYIRVPESWNQQTSLFLRAMNWLSPPLIFELASQLILSGDAQKMSQLQRTIATDRQIICKQLLQGIDFQTAESSYHLWLTLPGHWASELFMLEATKNNIHVTSSAYFSVNQSTSKNVRVSLMAINSESELKMGLTSLQKLLLAGPNVF